MAPNLQRLICIPLLRFGTSDSWQQVRRNARTSPETGKIPTIVKKWYPTKPRKSDSFFNARPTGRHRTGRTFGANAESKMWELTNFEIRMRDSLNKEFGDTNGATKFGNYTSARQVLTNEILEEIRGTAPNLTDHGPRHIRNVLNNVEKLLAGTPEYFSATELYLLGLGVLFHDVGNLDGRDGHNQRIAKYYDYARPTNAAHWANEKRLVIAAAKAHTGRAADGSRDTLKDLADDHHFNGEPVRLCEIAAVIRFADELAEGIQRTSVFLQAEGRYSRDAQIHHRYAAITDVAIDAGLNRISLTYNLILDELGSTIEEKLSGLHDLLEYVYKRVSKLDEERKYARHYCGRVLLPFRKTSVRIGVFVDGEFYDLGLEPVPLDDKVVPEGNSKKLPEINAAYLPDTIVGQIQRIVTEKAATQTNHAIGQDADGDSE